MRLTELMNTHSISSWDTERASRKGNRVLTAQTIMCYPYADRDVYYGPGNAVISHVWAVVSPTDEVLDYHIQIIEEYGY